MNIEDFIKKYEGTRSEWIDGEVWEQAGTIAEHGFAQVGLIASLHRYFGKKSDGENPGGWWIQSEAVVRYDHRNLFIHDAAGWKRDRVPERPKGYPVETKPDWVCEILSPSSKRHDQITKRDRMFQHKIPFYWIVDLDEQSITVLKWCSDGYIIRQTATVEQNVCLEPFIEKEFAVNDLLGLE